MTKEDVQLLFRYDRWANERTLAAASTLSVEQLTQNLGGSFPSVRDTLLHILGGAWTWLTFWKGPYEDPGFLAELRARREVEFKAEAFPDVATIRARCLEIENQQDEFVDGLTTDSLQKLLPARGTRIALIHLMQHVVNHATYHRGQISLMMRQLGAEPVATDFHLFLGESGH